MYSTIIRHEIKRKAYKLERHLYTPELNKLHFINGSTVNTPHITCIEKAIDYVLKQTQK